MKNSIKAILCSIILFSRISAVDAQKPPSSQGSKLVFSAIKGTVSKPDSIQLPLNAKSATLSYGDTTNFKILSAKNGRLVVVFAPSDNFIGIARATLNLMNATGKSIREIDLTGLSTKALEGENEPPLTLIVDALGYKTNIGWAGLANHNRPELQGDEIPFSLFKKAGNDNVEIIPVARYSPDFELPFGYYTDRSAKPDKHQVGILSKAGLYPENQKLFPAIVSGSKSFDPGMNEFGFYTAGPTHTAFSEDVWNMLYFPDNAVRATRIYPLKDGAGNQIKNTYLLCFEEAKNGDFNDYVFLVKNIIPVTKDPFATLFDGKTLHGWHSYLKNYGAGKDPDHNFRIEDSVLHVIGRDLGYVITDSGYKNFHFKVDFKWGERKWPPRDTTKRDAGMCYNIPFNDPDSVWPQSIECQIQEGDVGDFWLIGSSTITVRDTVNVPSPFIRMIKYTDAEKPTGEWNTVEVISYNGRCIHIVNGVVVNVGDHASLKSGKILLQSEFAEVYYRNVKIRKL